MMRVGERSVFFMGNSTKLGKIFELYIRAEVIAAGLSKGTQENYKNTMKLALGFFGDVDIIDITAEYVRDFQDHLLSYQMPDTAAGNIINFRSVLKYCNRKKLPVLDIEDIKIPKRKKRVINYLTESAAKDFIGVIGQKRRGYAEINRVRNIAIVETIYATGLRVGELCRLDRNTIRNRQFTVVGKSKEPRICFVTERVIKIINDYLQLRDDNSAALFVSNQTGNRITPGTVRRIFQFACSRSDFTDVHPHTLRHSYATKLLEKEVDIRYIADLMGHQSLDTTRLYTHFSNPKLKRIYDVAHAT